MTDEKRTRTPNPFTAYKRAQAALAKARRAAERAAALRAKTEEAAERAETAAAELPALEEAEHAAYEALQAALADTGVDTDDPGDDDE